MVVLYHLRLGGIWSNVPLFRNGYLFVDFFFVLSGFVMACQYENKLSNGLPILTFMKLRFSRIYPLHLAVLLAFLVRQGVSGLSETAARGEVTAYSWQSFISNVFLLQGMGIHHELTWNGPSWSISVEFYTYLVFGLVLLAAHKGRLWIYGLAAVTSAFAIAKLSPSYIDTTYQFGFLRAIYGFFCGAIVWAVYSKIHKSAKISTSPNIRSAILEISIVMVMLWFVCLAGKSWLNMFAPIMFSAVVLIFAFEAGIVSTTLKSRVFLKAGLYSYSVYLIHVLLLSLMRMTFRFVDKHLGTQLISNKMVDGAAQYVFGGNSAYAAIEILFILCVLMIIASQTYRYIEVPGQRFLRDRLGV